MSGERRGPWFLVTGLILGVALGLVYAWVISPVRYKETAPASLQAGYKDAYRSLIAAAFAGNGDVRRAQTRLALLNDSDPARALAAQAQQMIAQGGAVQEARQMALLAAALGQLPPPGPPASPTRAPTSTTGAAPVRFSPSPTLTHVPTLLPSFTASPTLQFTTTSFPTRTPTPTPRPPFTLGKVTPVCDPKLAGPLLQVEIRDERHVGVPGVGITVTWDGGQETFYTGLKPQVFDGYADFLMKPGVQYTLRLAEGGEPVNNLAAAECAPAGSSGASFWGGYRIEFGP
jgi:hypothetical protein